MFLVSLATSLPTFRDGVGGGGTCDSGTVVVFEEVLVSERDGGFTGYGVYRMSQHGLCRQAVVVTHETGWR